MAKSQETFNKKEREKKKAKKRKEKLERKQSKKETRDGNDLAAMIMYVDDEGNLVPEKPDPTKKVEMKIEDINVSTPKMEDRAAEAKHRKGFVKFFNDEKGYGFITDAITGENIFVHAAELDEPIKQQNKVTYEVIRGQKGLNAINVTVIK